MRIFIAGATGVIGRRLVPLLVANGHKVTALSRRPQVPGVTTVQGEQTPGATTVQGEQVPGVTTVRGELVPGVTTVQGEQVPGATTIRGELVPGVTTIRGEQVSGVTRVQGDVYDAAGLRDVVAAARPDVVIHQLTDLTSRDFAANIRIRREGTRNLVDAALAAGVRRVISQSVAWAYEPGSTPADESTPLDLQAADDNRRHMVEAVATLEAITAEAPEWVALRYGMLYGPDTWYTKGALMADLATAGQLPANQDVTSFLHVDDAAEAAAAALTWPSGPINIVDNDPAPATTWLPAFTASVGAPIPTENDNPRTPWARGATNTHAHTLGWTPTHPTWRTSFHA